MTSRFSFTSRRSESSRYHSKICNLILKIFNLWMFSIIFTHKWNVPVFHLHRNSRSRHRFQNFYWIPLNCKTSKSWSLWNDQRREQLLPGFDFPRKTWMKYLNLLSIGMALMLVYGIFCFQCVFRTIRIQEVFRGRSHFCESMSSSDSPFISTMMQRLSGQSFTAELIPKQSPV